MNNDDYIHKRKRLIHYFNDEFSISGDESQQVHFNMVSASLLNYLPEIAYSKHQKIYRQILLHKQLSILEQSNYPILEGATIINLHKEALSLLKKQGTIICTFHLGSYRLINLWLVKNKIPFTLVMGNEVIEKEGKNFALQYASLSKQEGQRGFDLINAEASTAGLQMLRELRKGRTLVLYIDGNTGAGINTEKNENSHIINFLSQQLYARTGIGYLAHATRTPILPVVNYRKSMEEICLHFFDPIIPSGNNRNDFAKEATQQLYDLTAPFIRVNPEQWEAWLYLHKTVKVNTANASPKKEEALAEWLRFNSALFGIFKISGIPFLFQKRDYSFYEINEPLYEALISSQHRLTGKKCFTDPVFKELYQQGVFINEGRL